MQLQTGTYHGTKGWNAAMPTNLDSPQTLILAFGAKAYETNPHPFEALADAFPQSIIAGCSTAGEIAGDCVNDESVSVAYTRFSGTRLRRAHVEVADAGGSLQAGISLAQQLSGDDRPCAVLIISDGTCVNGTALVQGLTQSLPKGTSIFGGLAGDGSQFSSTWVLDGSAPRRNQICAIGFYGNQLRIGHGCDHGWSDFGPERRITKSEGNVLHELDGKPALDLGAVRVARIERSDVGDHTANPRPRSAA